MNEPTTDRKSIFITGAASGMGRATIRKVMPLKKA